MLGGYRSRQGRVSVGAPAGVFALAVLALTAVQVRMARQRYDGVLSAPGPIDVTVVPQDSTLADGRPVELLALGDSGMAGVGVDTVAETLPVQIADRVAAVTGRPVHVVSRAESGALTREVVQQVAGQGSAPDVVVLMVGTNDVTHLTPIWRLEKDTESLLERLGDLGAPVVMSSLPEFRAMRAVPPFPRALAEGRAAQVRIVQRGATRAVGAVGFVDVRRLVGSEFVEDDAKVSSDRFHPSAIGYARIADVMAPAVAAAAVCDTRQSRTQR